MRTQRVRVLDALDRGLEASFEIADATGIPQSSVAVYLGFLRAAGVIKPSGWFYAPGRPRPFTRWRLTSPPRKAS